MTTTTYQPKASAGRTTATAPAPVPTALPKAVKASGNPLALATPQQQQEANSNNKKVIQLKDDPEGLAQLLAQVIKSKTQMIAVSTSTVENIPEADKAVQQVANKGKQAASAVGRISPLAGVILNDVSEHLPGVADGLVDKILTPKASANVSNGSTRNLIAVNGKEGRRAELGQLGVVYQLIKSSVQVTSKARFGSVLKAYVKVAGRPLETDLGERVRDPVARNQILSLLPPLIPEATLALDGFLEQVAVGMVYSDQTAEELNTDVKEDRRLSSPSQLLKTFGYKAGPPIYGRWGFQMRTFTPIEGKARWPHPIVAFRGTEGVQFDVDGKKAIQKARLAGGATTPAALAAEQHKGVEGTVDTLVGDFSHAEVGWLQYHPNADLVKANLEHIKSFGKAYVTGHSLGGALAQIVAAHRTSYVHQLITFQAANVDQKTVELFKKNSKDRGCQEHV